MTNDLESLPHLDPKAAEMLREAGIASPAALREHGTADAFLAVKAKGLGPPLSLLWAIEGALTGVEPHDISADRRNDLLHQTGDLLS